MPATPAGDPIISQNTVVTVDERGNTVIIGYPPDVVEFWHIDDLGMDAPISQIGGDTYDGP